MSAHNGDFCMLLGKARFEMGAKLFLRCPFFCICKSFVNFLNPDFVVGNLKSDLISDLLIIDWAFCKKRHLVNVNHEQHRADDARR